MGFVTPIDRLLHAGGTAVTLAFWLLSIVGALLTVYGPLPIAFTPVLTGVPLVVVWLRNLNITIAELLLRAGYTELRDGEID